MKQTLQTFTCEWICSEKLFRRQFIISENKKLLGFSIASDKEARNGYLKLDWGDDRLLMPLTEALFQKHSLLDGSPTIFKSISNSEELVAILPDGEHPLFDLSKVSGVSAANNLVAFEVDGPLGLIGVITLLLRETYP